MGDLSSPTPARRRADVALPPGQAIATDLSADASATAPGVSRADWQLVLTTEHGDRLCWDWVALRGLPSERVRLDLHDVSGWSVLDTIWDAVSVHQIVESIRTTAEFVTIASYSGYTTNLPLEDLIEMPTWLAFAHDGALLTPAEGAPVRMLVPHLYLWKSVKWLHAITLRAEDHPGTCERRGSHNYGDPWRSQRRRGD